MLGQKPRLIASNEETTIHEMHGNSVSGILRILSEVYDPGAKLHALTPAG